MSDEPMPSYERWRPSKAQMDAMRLAKAQVEDALLLRRLLHTETDHTDENEDQK